MKNAKLSVKLIGGFVITACLILGGGLVGWFSSYLLSSDLGEVYRTRIPAMRSLEAISESQGRHSARRAQHFHPGSIQGQRGENSPDRRPR